MDYVYHFNANMKFVSPIGDEILPKAENGYLAICPWANITLRQQYITFPQGNISLSRQGKYHWEL